MALAGFTIKLFVMFLLGFLFFVLSFIFLHEKKVSFTHNQLDVGSEYQPFGLTCIFFFLVIIAVLINTFVY